MKTKFIKTITLCLVLLMCLTCAVPVSATTDSNSVTMLEDNRSANTEAPLTVVNTSGFDLPQTGDMGTAIFAVTGILLMAGAGIIILFACRKKRSHQ